MERYLAAQVRKDLERKPVFVAGPRQVGKTTMALSLLGDHRDGYLNWDIPEHREKILLNELPPTDIWVFDEIHKYGGWRNWLKGLIDRPDRKQQILVTGSARLDFYRRGGDSLQGRYNFLRLHGLSVAELGLKDSAGLKKLLDLGGFPEPYFSGSEIEARRWSRAYRQRLIQEDLVSLEKVTDLGRIEQLLLFLPRYVGSPLSVNTLREDLGVAHQTVAKWLDMLERLYAFIRIAPFGARGLRGLSKARKHYHFDWRLVQDEALRFENLVAMHLVKWVHYLQDTEGREMDLRFFRDGDGREVDFVVTEDGLPRTFIECKWRDTDISKPLRYLRRKFPMANTFQIHAAGKKDYVSSEGIRIMPAHRFLADLV